MVLAGNIIIINASKFITAESMKMLLFMLPELYIFISAKQKQNWITIFLKNSKSLFTKVNQNSDKVI